MTVWVVNWEEEKVSDNYPYNWVWVRKRKSFDDKLEANLYADYLISSDYKPKVRNVYIEAF